MNDDSHDDLVANAERFAATFSGGDLPTPPSRRLAVVTCMDSRLDVFAVFGLRLGEAHVIRNAGALVSEDALRSLVLSQRLLGTRAVFVVAHTGCGLHGLDGEAFVAGLEADSGCRPRWDPGAFGDLDASVTASLEAIRACPHLVAREAARGFVYDVHTGRLREVTVPMGAAAAEDPASG